VNLCSHNITFQIDLEKNKAGEISKLQAALREMEQQMVEAIEMQERELGKRAIEEALTQERDKITLLTNEVEELKVLFFSINIGIIQTVSSFSVYLLFCAFLCFSYTCFFWVSSLAYPNLLETKGSAV
jgi:hypothetical protein